MKPEKILFMMALNKHFKQSKLISSKHISKIRKETNVNKLNDFYRSVYVHMGNSPLVSEQFSIAVQKIIYKYFYDHDANYLCIIRAIYNYSDYDSIAYIKDFFDEVRCKIELNNMHKKEMRKLIKDINVFEIAESFDRLRIDKKMALLNKNDTREIRYLLSSACLITDKKRKEHIVKNTMSQLEYQFFRVFVLKLVDYDSEIIHYLLRYALIMNNRWVVKFIIKRKLISDYKNLPEYANRNIYYINILYWGSIEECTNCERYHKGKYKQEHEEMITFLKRIGLLDK